MQRITRISTRVRGGGCGSVWRVRVLRRGCRRGCVRGSPEFILPVEQHTCNISSRLVPGYLFLFERTAIGFIWTHEEIRNLFRILSDGIFGRRSRPGAVQLGGAERVYEEGDGFRGGRVD